MTILATLPEPPEIAAAVDAFDLCPYLDMPQGKSPVTEARNQRVRAVHSVGAALHGIGSTFRHHIRSAFSQRGGRCRPLNDDLRALLSLAIFEVENDLEHRQPTHAQVRHLRAARNRLYDDLGWNEYAVRSTPTTP